MENITITAKQNENVYTLEQAKQVIRQERVTKITGKFKELINGVQSGKFLLKQKLIGVTMLAIAVCIQPYAEDLVVSLLVGFIGICMILSNESIIISTNKYERDDEEI